MSWNYRIIAFDTHLALHEVFYDEKGAIKSWTVNPISFVCDVEDGSDSIVKSLEKALADAKTRPILKVSDSGSLVEQTE